MSLHARLEEGFDRPVDVWSCGTTDHWLPVVFDPLDSNHGVEAALRYETDEDFRAELDGTIDSALAQRCPLTLRFDSGRMMVVVPLDAGSDDARFVAILGIESQGAALSLRLAETVLAWDADTERSRSLREENDFFVHQLRDDFEGLTFLRLVAKSLADYSENESELKAIEENLPGLGSSLGAQEVHFLSADSAGFPMLASSWQVDRGSEFLADAAMAADLVLAFRDLIGNEPLLLNRFDSRAEASQFPGVHEAILMPARSRTGVFGWFVVLNRKPYGPPGVLDQNQSDKEFGTSQVSLLTTVTAMFASHANNRLMIQERERLLINMVRALVSAVELKDRYTCGHSERVGLFARRVAEEMGVPDEACQKLYLTGLLHDIGKIGVSDAVLNKEGPLTPEEFELIKRHPAEGWGILRELDELRYVLPGVLQHHERVDGKGYPDGLRGDAISLDGRVLAVVDAYDAMTSDRAYRKGMPHDRAIAILTEGAGTQWDPIVVSAFLAASSDIAAMRDLYRPRCVIQREVGAGFDEVCIPALPSQNTGEI